MALDGHGVTIATAVPQPAERSRRVEPVITGEGPAVAGRLVTAPIGDWHTFDDADSDALVALLCAVTSTTSPSARTTSGCRTPS